MNDKYKGVILVLISSVMFASYGIWFKLIGAGFGVFFQSYVRAIIVLIIFALLCYFLKKWRRVDKNDYKSLAIFSIIGLFVTAPLAYSNTYAGVGISGLLFYATYLIVQYLFGFFFYKEKVNKIKIIALILSLLGLVILFSDSLRSYGLLPLLMAMLAGASSGSEIAYSKDLSDKYSSLQLSIIAWSTTLITHLPISLYLGERQIIPAIDIHWLAMLTFALIASGALLIVMTAYRYVDATVGGLVGLLEVVFVVYFGWQFFDEPVTISMLLGSAIIMVSSALPVLYSRRS